MLSDKNNHILSFDIPRIFVPFKPETIRFKISEDIGNFDLKISHNLAKKGLTILSFDRIFSDQIEVVVINLNGFDFILNGLSSIQSFEKYGAGSLNNLKAGTIRTRKDEPFAEIIL